MLLMIDWIEDRLAGRPPHGHDERLYFRSRARGGGTAAFTDALAPFEV